MNIRQPDIYAPKGKPHLVPAPQRSLTEVLKAAEAEEGADFVARAEAELREIMAENGAAPPEPKPLTDIEYVANSVDALRHLDLGAMWDGIFGPEMPKDRADGMEKLARWAETNKRKVAA